MTTSSPDTLRADAPRSLGVQGRAGPTGGGPRIPTDPRACRGRRSPSAHEPLQAGAPGLGGKKAAHPAVAGVLEGTVSANPFPQQPLTPPANVFSPARS